MNLLTRKLSNFLPLSPPEQRILDTLASREASFPAGVDIVAEGMSPRLFWVREGMAVRYRNLPDGGRQIMTFLIPGDLCDEHMFLMSTMDHSIGTVTAVRIASISHETMMEVFAYHPRISAALRLSALQEQAILRERIVALGRRDARGRLAYLLCELLWRHAAVGLTDGATFRLPLTQAELGDTLGLTAVHINYVLKEFRQRGLIAMEHKVIRLLDVVSLQEIAGLGGGYLDGSASEELVRYFSALEAKTPKDTTRHYLPNHGRANTAASGRPSV